MKQIVFLALTLLLWSAASMNAQVNIGSLDAPHKGAILDLSQSGSDLGVLLPKVYIFNTKDFTLPADTEIDPIGMVVYNLNSTLSDGAGLYSWTGTEWKSMGGSSVNSCLPVTATAAMLKTGTNAKITVTVTAGNPTYSYIWSKGGNTVRTITNVNTSSDNYITTGAGTYTCTVTNPCTATPISFTFTVDASGEALIDNDNGTFTDKDGNLVYDGETYNPVESDIPGIYKDKDGEIVYTGADGIPGTADDDTYVIPETPIPMQDIRATFVTPAPGRFLPSGGASTQIVLDYANPYGGKVKYLSSDPGILSVSATGTLTSTSDNVSMPATITAIFDDGSIASTTIQTTTTAQQGSNANKLDLVQSSTVNTRINELISLSIGVQAVNGSNTVYNIKSLSYQLISDGGTGSTLSPQGCFLHVGATPGTVTVKAIATNFNNEEFYGTITVVVGGIPSAETGYETTSTNWLTLDPAPEYAGGSGTEADPYLISSVRQLKKLAIDISVFGGVDVSYGKFFELTTDLDFAEDESITSNLIGSFYGTFDGKGHLIKNLTINTTTSGATLFASLRYGELKNLGRIGGESKTTGNNGAGLISEFTNAKLINCFNTAEVTSATYAGGLIGVTSTANAAIAETIPSIIENCYNTGKVTATGNGAGGLNGTSLWRGGTLIIKNSYNSGEIKSPLYTGGLIGNISGGYDIAQIYDLSNTFNFGNVITTGSSNLVGAAIGGTVSENPASTPITITTSNVISRPDVAKVNTSTIVHFQIGFLNAYRPWRESVELANPTMKEDAKYTLDYSQSAAFATELGSAFKYASGRTPKLAWEK